MERKLALVFEYLDQVKLNTNSKYFIPPIAILLSFEWIELGSIMNMTIIMFGFLVYDYWSWIYVYVVFIVSWDGFYIMTRTECPL